MSCFVELLFPLRVRVSWLRGEVYFFRGRGQKNLRNTVGQGRRDLACGNGSEGGSDDGFSENSERSVL